MHWRRIFPALPGRRCRADRWSCCPRTAPCRRRAGRGCDRFPRRRRPRWPGRGRAPAGSGWRRRRRRAPVETKAPGHHGAVVEQGEDVLARGDFGGGGDPLGRPRVRLGLHPRGAVAELAVVVVAPGLQRGARRVGDGDGQQGQREDQRDQRAQSRHHTLCGSIHRGRSCGLGTALSSPPANCASTDVRVEPPSLLPCAGRQSACASRLSYQRGTRAFDFRRAAP